MIKQKKNIDVLSAMIGNLITSGVSYVTCANAIAHVVQTAIDIGEHELAKELDLIVVDLMHAEMLYRRSTITQMTLN